MRNASLTARVAAAYRARASARTNAICNDPWAKILAGEGTSELLAAGDAAVPEMELGIALRTAWLDDAVRSFDGPQVVLLGAGFDTRAARLARPGLRFFEVDHPATQASKREALASAPGYPRDASTFVPCDFEHDEFTKALTTAGFQAARPATVLWEGVTAYLTESAVRATFRALSDLGLTGRMYFDYIGKAAGADGVGRFAKDAGEPFIFTTNDIAPLVREEGLEATDVFSVDEAHRRRTGSGAEKAPFFARWFFVEARR